MINTTLCYIEKNDSYLMIHRTKKKNDCNHDKWIGIGGKFEMGESPKDCVLREVREETGLVLKKAEYRGLVTFVSKDGDDFYYELMHLFWSDSFEGEEGSDEGTGASASSGDFVCPEGDLEWVPKAKMNDLPHWEGDEIFLNLLDKRVPFFSLKLVYENGKLVQSTLE